LVPVAAVLIVGAVKPENKRDNRSEQRARQGRQRNVQDECENHVGNLGSSDRLFVEDSCRLSFSVIGVSLVMAVKHCFRSTHPSPDPSNSHPCPTGGRASGASTSIASAAWWRRGAGPRKQSRSSSPGALPRPGGGGRARRWQPPDLRGLNLRGHRRPPSGSLDTVSAGGDSAPIRR
jgi:hypothetical protein